MSLTNIEYGSLASSEVLNRNFTYLDNKITELAGSLNASISSILSNYATMNTSFGVLTDTLNDSMQTLSSEMQEFKTKVKNAVELNTMSPNWAGLISISGILSYKAPSNGYMLLVPDSAAKGTIKVDNVQVNIKYRDVSADNASELILIPLKYGNIISSSISFKNAYFLPAVLVEL